MTIGIRARARCFTICNFLLTKQPTTRALCRRVRYTFCFSIHIIIFFWPPARVQSTQLCCKNSFVIKPPILFFFCLMNWYIPCFTLFCVHHLSSLRCPWLNARIWKTMCLRYACVCVDPRVQWFRAWCGPKKLTSPHIRVTNHFRIKRESSYLYYICAWICVRAAFIKMLEKISHLRRGVNISTMTWWIFW